jgi:PAS domain S-box-containing protein
VSPPLPENEAERLAALRQLDVLDTSPEEAFDELTELAANICKTPVALISLLDEKRQWLKSTVGWTLRETPREFAFCAHTILGTDVFVVPDASADERFAANPLVTSATRVRFYAGAPLVTPEGHALGTLCVIDHEPRQLDPEQARALHTLGRQVVAQLRLRKQLAEQSRLRAELARHVDDLTAANHDLRAEVARRGRAEQALRESEQRLDLAMRISRLGPWEVDLVAGRATASGQILGHTGGPVSISLRDIEALVHPDDSAARLAALEEVASGRSPLLKSEIRMRDANGEWAWVYSCGQALEHDAAGRATRLIGMSLDVTERKRAEEALRQSENTIREQKDQLAALLDHLPVMVFGVNGDGRYSVWNRECERVLGYPKEEVLGKTRRDLYPHWYPDPDYREWVLAQAITRDYRDLETSILKRDGTLRVCSWSNLSKRVRIPDLPVWGVGIDVTERKRTEDALRESEHRLDLAMQISRQTSWEANLVTGWAAARGPWDGLGYGPNGIPQSQAAWVELVHPEDRPALETAWRDILEGRTAICEVEYRVRSKAGAWVWMHSCGSVVERDAAGRPVRVVGTLMDVTERRQVEDALRQANTRLDVAMQAANQSPWEVDLLHDRATLVARPPRPGLAPISLPEAMGELDSLIHPDDAPARAEAYRAIREGRTPLFVVEFRVRDDRGDWAWLRSHGKVIEHDAAGRPARMVGVIMDVTERKHTEDALRESERQMNSLVSQLPGLAYRCLFDENYTALYAAGHFLPIAGIGPEDLLSGRTSYLDIMHPDDREPTRRRVVDAVARREPFDNEHRIFDREGHVKWILSRGHGVYGDDGSLRFLEGLNIDVTRQKLAEEQLSRALDQLRLLLESSGEGLYGIDLEGRCTFINRAGARMLGYLPAEALGRDMHALIHHTRADGTPYPTAECPIVRAFRVGTGCRVSDEVLWRRDGSAIPVEYSSSPILDGGHCRGAVITFTDITERKKAEEELKSARDTAQQASRAKSVFLAKVSHEFRTPLNAILGMGELVFDTPLTEQQRKYLAVIRSSTDVLLEMIEDLLDSSKIEAGKLELDRVPFSPRGLVGDSLRSLALRAHRKGLELICRVRPDVPVAVVGDPARLRQVLTNLIGNAIKFTDAGEVVVDVSTAEGEAGSGPETGRDPRACTLAFSVRDTGIGIPRDMQLKIFEAFEQVDGTTTGRYGGAGLGLSIASQLVSLMGGRIAVESAPAQGSTFRFAVRLQRSPAGSTFSTPGAPAQLRSLSALVVDHNATSRQTLEGWLRGWGVRPTAVGDGPSALNALQQAAAHGSPFELVILVTNIPEPGMHPVADWLDKAPAYSQSGVLFLIADDQASKMEECDGLDRSICVTKPVQEEELLDAICEALVLPGSAGDGRLSERQERAPDAAEPLPPLRVLLAEDNPFNQMVVSDLLSGYSHTVRVAADGRAALAALDQEDFDVLLLDVHMPELDGFQVVAVRRRREQGTGRRLPIIALTARFGEGERERCLQAGMDDYLAKPTRAADLLAALHRVVARGEGFPAGERAPSSQELLDTSTLLAACGGDARLLEKMCRHFRAEAPDRLAELREALKARDTTRLREGAHKLGGMVSAFSAAAARLAALLERSAAAGDLEESAKHHVRLAETIAGVRQALDTVSIEQLRASQTTAGTA